MLNTGSEKCLKTRLIISEIPSEGNSRIKPCCEPTEWRDTPGTPVMSCAFHAHRAKYLHLSVRLLARKEPTQSPSVCRTSPYILRLPPRCCERLSNLIQPNPELPRGSQSVYCRFQSPLFDTVISCDLASLRRVFQMWFLQCSSLCPIQLLIIEGKLIENYFDNWIIVFLNHLSVPASQISGFA